MSKIDTKDLEMISAYLDGELSGTDKDYIEQKLQQSPTMRSSLAELRMAKQAVTAVPPLPEDPYFETRLMQNLLVQKHGVSAFFSSRKPALVLATFTLVFLVVFKFQPNLFDEVLENNKANLASFYAKNLMPLISATNLTNDDVLNFAFNKYLPINKDEKQVISFGKNAQGEQIIEVKTADVAGMPLSMDTFAKTFGLNQEQKKEANKILERYTDKIAAAVLVNDKNSVAVNASLWGYHDQLRKELLGYVSQVNSAAFKHIMPNGSAELIAAADKAAEAIERSPASNYYYYISPDTFFASQLPVDTDGIDQAIKQMRYAEAVRNYSDTERDQQMREVMSTQAQINNELKRVKVNLHQVAKISRGAANLAQSVQIFADSGICKVVIPKAVSGIKTNTKLNNIAAKLDSAFSSFKAYSYAYSNDENTPISVPEQTYKKFGRPMTVRSGAALSASPERLTADSIASKYNLYFDNSNSYLKNKKQSQSAVIAIDSLQKLLRYYLGDSIALHKYSNSGTALEEVRKEMEQVRKELEKVRKELQQRKNKESTQEIKNPLEL